MTIKTTQNREARHQKVYMTQQKIKPSKDYIEYLRRMALNNQTNAKNFV